MEKGTAKRLVIKAGKELSERGLIARTWGNVSCRLDDSSFVITASGKNYLTLTEDEVVHVTLADLSYEGDIKPSSEKKIHRAIYRLRKDAGFLIHTHQENASAISAMDMDSITLDREYEGIGRKVICAGYALPGTEKLCKNTVEAVKRSQGNAVILKHHGAVCFGRDYEEAFAVVRSLEDACGRYLKMISKEIRDADAPRSREHSHSENALWNDNKLILDFVRREDALRPYLDDFAQIIGVKLKVVNNRPGNVKKALKSKTSILVRGRGAFCVGKNQSDAQAISMLIEKNCLAYFAAQASPGGRPIKSWEAALMRQNYLRNYAKLSE